MFRVSGLGFMVLFMVKTSQNQTITATPSVISTPRQVRLPGGWRKHIRIEKARIRREAENPQEAQERIRELYTRISSRPKS